MSTQYDLATVVGTYTDKSGEEKKRWMTIGSMWIDEDGEVGTILLNRSFNPAGVPIDPLYPNSGQVFITAYEKE